MSIHDWCECITCDEIECYTVQKNGKKYSFEAYYDMLSKFGDEELEEVYLFTNENGYIDILFKIAIEEDENVFE